MMPAARASQYLFKGIFTLIWIYALYGATIGVVAVVALQQFSLAILLFSVVVWLLLRWRFHWRWSATPLDVPLLLWGAAFGLSLAANGDVWRRIVIGLWYAGLYIGVWYLLWNMLSNRAVTHVFLSDLLLLGGVVVLAFGCLQIVIWSRDNLADIVTGLRAVQLPRPVSTLGNPNAFGTVLAMLLPLATMRLLNPRNPLERVIMLLYTLLTAFLLLMTYSRGAWLGAGIGMVAFALLYLDMNHLIRPSAWRSWWARQPRLTHLLLGVVAISVLAVVALGTALFAASFNQGGRSTELRTDIWEVALSTFAEHPVAGTGLFTFGQSLMAVQSIPPMNPHSHAHSLPLNVLAELGLLGFAALCVTIFFLARAVRRNWLRATARIKILYAGAVGSASAFAGHHLLDTTTMTPAVALSALFVLVLSAHPPESVPVATRLRRLQFASVVLLWGILLATGFWSSSIYGRYLTIMNSAISTQNYAAAAAALQDVIDADPQLALYHMQQGYLYGLAAAEGDDQAAQAGIGAYRQFLELEPYHAVSWANLSALLWQTGEQSEAVTAMQRASALAPRTWQFAAGAGAYLEAMGQDAEATIYYELSIIGNVMLLPFWTETPLRQSIADEALATPLAQTALLLEAGNRTAAADLWEANNFGRFASTPYAVMRLLFALADNDRSAAEQALAEAKAAASTPYDEGWVALGEARLALYDGDAARSAGLVEAALLLFVPDLSVSEDVYGTNFAGAQFLRLALARQYLPQVFYPTVDPLLLYLLNATAARLNLE